MTTSPPAHGPDACPSCVALGTTQQPRYRGSIWICTATTPTLVRYTPWPGWGEAVAAPLWALPPNDWPLHLARARAVRQGSIDLGAIPTLTELRSFSDAVRPAEGYHLAGVRVEAQRGPGWEDWHIATITVSPVARWRRARDRASASGDEFQFSALQNAAIQAANDHPELRRLAVTHSAHSRELTRHGLNILLEPWEESRRSAL